MTANIRRTIVGGTTFVLMIGAIAGYLLFKPESDVVKSSPFHVAEATPTQLASAADMRIYFGHQSVGRDLLQELPAVYVAAGMKAPRLVQSTSASDLGDAGILHSLVGENGDPIGKIQEFDTVVRSGLGDVVDVALVKLCYSDFHRGDDVTEVFDVYRKTLAALERDYPDVVFLHATSSLTTEASRFERAKDRVKEFVGRSRYWPDPSRNVVRHEYNELIRSEYGESDRLFDLAAIQAAGSSGELELRSFDGAEYLAMRRSLARDPGHHTPEGSQIVASAFIAAVAAAG